MTYLTQVPSKALPDRFPSVYDRFRPFIWRGPTPKLSANQALVRFPPSRAPFKNGENGENGASSRSGGRRESTKTHPPLLRGDATFLLHPAPLLPPIDRAG